MGSRFEIWLRGDDATHLDAVAESVLEEIARLEGVLSRFDARSEIARVNREAFARPVRVDRELFALLAECEQARRLTNGYFDLTAATGARGLALDAERCTVQFTRANAAIDPGAVGKGYALDRGRALIERFNVTDGLLQGGTSSVLAFGPREWPLAIRHPVLQSAAEPVGRVMLAGRAFSCSAVRRPEQSESDVVNPLTGAPLQGNAACVVLAASAVKAEFFSTALLAMGRERAASYLAETPDAELRAGWFDPAAGFAWFV
jgi:FAD:protein FMN transferase